jgi:tetratricopeptide (TPR) repeat protein
MRRRLTAVDVQGGTAMEDTVSVKPPEARSAFVAPSLMQAWDALQQGRLDQAEGLYQTVVQADPQNVDGLLGLATIANRRGNNDQAVRQYERVLELDPRNASAQAGLISIIGQADPQLSESRLKELISREPTGFLYFALGNVYARQGQWAQAQQAYFQAYQLQPDSADYAYNLAVGLEHIGQTKIALTYYRKAVDLSSGKGHASFDPSRVQERIGQLSARIGND